MTTALAPVIGDSERVYAKSFWHGCTVHRVDGHYTCCGDHVGLGEVIKTDAARILGVGYCIVGWPGLRCSVCGQPAIGPECGMCAAEAVDAERAYERAAGYRS